MVHIKENVSVLPDEILARYINLSSATVYEAMGKRGAVNSDIKPITRGMRLCGCALTVRCHPGDNLMLIKAISMARHGMVIICDMGGWSEEGSFGEVLAVESVTRRVSGLVINSSVRDSEAIIRLGFPVFSSGLCIKGTSKAVLGTINHPVVVGGVAIHPGDLILGDDDGVVAVPRAECEETALAAEKRDSDERKVMDRLRNGEKLFDIYGYQRVLDNLGCKEF